MSKDPLDDYVQNWEVEIRRGVIQLFVLHVLSKQDQNGKAITDEIFEMTKGRLEVPIGTIYPLLKRFGEALFIETYQIEGEDKRLKNYTLTNLGREYYQRILEKWLRYSIVLSDALHKPKEENL